VPHEDLVIGNRRPSRVEDPRDVSNLQLHRVVPHVVFGISGSEDRLGLLDQIVRVTHAHLWPQGDVAHGARGGDELPRAIKTDKASPAQWVRLMWRTSFVRSIATNSRSTENENDDALACSVSVADRVIRLSSCHFSRNYSTAWRSGA